MRNCRWISLALVFCLATLSGFADAQVTRIEERDPAVTYLQNRWYDIPDERWSDGEALGAFEAGSTMTVDFSGTGITWIGYRCSCAAGTARLYMDGVFLGTVNTYAAVPEPLAEIYSVDGLAAGEHSFTIEVTGSYHASGTSAYMLVDAFDIEGSGGGSSDTVPPQLSVTSPPDGATATGMLLVTAEASDNVLVQDVRVLIDGTQHGVADTSAPYSIAIDTSSLADGSHELRVVATDSAGNTASEVRTIETANSGYIEESHESISYTGAWYDIDDAAVSGGSVVGAFEGGSTATVNFNGTGITWIGYRCACAAGIARVYVDGNLAATVDTYAAERTPRAEIFSATNLTAGEHELRIEHTGNYHNEGTSAYLLIDAFRIANGDGSSGGGNDDTTPPTIVLNLDGTGTRQGVITASAEAADDTGVVGVQFLLNGEALGAEDTSAPYSVTWDTATVPEGPHVFSARARDEAGNIGVPSTWSFVDVDNLPRSEYELPGIVFEGPGFGATVSGTVNLTATASDNVGIARILYDMDGKAAYAGTTAPYSVSWPTQEWSDGSYALRAISVDRDGNSYRSAILGVNVWNSAGPPPVARITFPAEGATLSGTVTLTGEAFMPSGLGPYSTFVIQPDDGTIVSAPPPSVPDTALPLTEDWDTTRYPDGQYRIFLSVDSETEDSYYSHFVRVTVDN